MNEIFHGGNIARAIERYGGRAKDWLDLSTGINPRSWTMGTISHCAWTRLPGTMKEEKLLAAAREYYGVSEAFAVCCANGTQAIIQMLPRLFEQNCRVEIVHPTYEEHGHCWQQEGHEVVGVSDIDAIGFPDIAIVVNPNNPDGRMVKRPLIISLAQRLAETGGMLIVDEAFGDSFPQLTLAGCGLDNVLVLKSFGKFFGLAGVRLGFAIGAKPIVDKLRMQSGPWAVSGPALDIGAQALVDQNWVENTRRWISHQMEKQMNVLADAGLEITGNGGLFVQTRHEGSGEIYENLASRRILVRKFPARTAYLRFGLCATDDELQRLATSLRESVNG